MNAKPLGRRIGLRLLAVAALGCAAAVILAAPALAAPAWLAPTDLSAPLHEASNADVAMDEGGDLIAVWQRSGSISPSVEASVRPAGGSYSAPIELASPATAPRVAMNQSGTAVAVFGHFDGTNNLIQARVRPPGGSFSAATTIATLGSGFSVSPEVAINAAGEAAAVWLRKEGSTNVVQVATMGAGGSFSAPVDLSDSSHEASDPQVAIAPNGEAAVVWRGYSGTNPNVIEFASGKGASFSPALGLSSAAGAFEPQVALDAAGDATVVWSAVGEPNPEPVPATVEMTSRAGGGAFAAPVVLSDPSEAAVDPQLAVNPGGEALVAWSRSNGANSILQASIRPPGGAFAAAVDLSASGEDAENPAVAINAAGAATVAWQAGSPHLVKTAVRSPGAPFGAPLEISAPGEDASFPEVAMDQAGDAVAVWSRSNGTNQIAQAAGYDAVNPQLRDLVIPANATVGTPVAFSVKPFDVWPIAATGFEFGDGSLAAGSSVSHTYSAPGTYRVSVHTADQAANAASASATISVVASNAFRFGKTKRNRKKGTVVLTVELPGPGKIALAGKAVKKVVKRSAKAGSVKLTVAARGKALSQLKRKGKAKVRASVTFSPDGGPSASRSITVVLSRKP